MQLVRLLIKQHRSFESHSNSWTDYQAQPMSIFSRLPLMKLTEKNLIFDRIFLLLLPFPFAAVVADDDLYFQQ